MMMHGLTNFKSKLPLPERKQQPEDGNGYDCRNAALNLLYLYVERWTKTLKRAILNTNV